MEVVCVKRESIVSTFPAASGVTVGGEIAQHQLRGEGGEGRGLGFGLLEDDSRSVDCGYLLFIYT